MESEAKEPKVVYYPYLSPFQVKSEQDLIGNATQIKKVSKYLKDYKGKGIIISGETNIGKTTCVNFLLKKFNFLPISTPEEFELIHFKEITGKKKIILLDGIDETPINKDKLKDIKTLVLENDIPVIIICKNISKSIKNLLGWFDIINFKPPNEQDFLKYYNRVIGSNGSASASARGACGDIKEFICNLPFTSPSAKQNEMVKKTKTKFDENYSDNESFILNLTNEVFLKEDKNVSDLLILHSKEKTLLTLSMHENYLKFCKDIDEIVNIIDDLSYTDIIGKFIYSNQEWNLYEYQGLYSGCTVFNIKNTPKVKPRINFTSILSKMSTKSIRCKNVRNLKTLANLNNIILDNETIILLRNKLYSLLTDSDNIIAKVKEAAELMKVYNIDPSVIDSLFRTFVFDVQNKKISQRVKNLLSRDFNEITNAKPVNIFKNS